MCSVYTAVNAPYRSTIKLPVSISMAVLQLQMNHLSQPLPSTFFPLLFQTRIFGDKVVQVFNFFMYWISFLLPNRQCQSTKWNTKHCPQPVVQFHPLFIHHRTTDKNGNAPFMSTLGYNM